MARACDAARVTVRHGKAALAARGARRTAAIEWSPQRYETLTIRPLAKSDGPSWTASMRANEARMSPWWDTIDDWQLATDSRAFLAHFRQFERARRRGEGVALAIVERRDEGEAVVGELLAWHVEPGFRALEIGLWARPGIDGRELLGVITAAMDRAFHERGLRRVSAPIACGNRYPRRLYRLLGFQREGLLRESRLMRGIATDFEVFGLLAGDYADNRPQLEALLIGGAPA